MSATLSFDNKAQTWDADPIKQERALAVAAALCQRVPLSTAWQALEYGCGTGLLSFALQADLGESSDHRKIYPRDEFGDFSERSHQSRSP
jgi:ubiquinone/menaquinone biosynthesis C-methylase UbiE